MSEIKNFSELLGHTITDMSVSSDKEIITYVVDGKAYYQYHEQDCCESVQLEEVVGEFSEIIGFPILLAEEVFSHEPPTSKEESWEEEEENNYDGDDSQTWTFYKLVTVRGYVTMRWYGTSNGYYSETVGWYNR